MGWAVGGTVSRRRLGLAAGTVACLLAVCAAWVGAAVPQSSDIVVVRVRPDQRQPASAPGHVCSTDDEHGTICAAYAAGDRPVDDLVLAIARRGLRPRVLP